MPKTSRILLGMDDLNKDKILQKQFMEDIAKHYNADVVSIKQVREFIKEKNLPFPHFLNSSPSVKTAFGSYRVRKTDSNGLGADVSANLDEPVSATVTPIKASEAVRNRIASNASESFYPEKDKTYVPFGFYNDLKKIIGAGIFYPVYITGLSGNGKTVMVEQICAKLQREMIRVNITKETDETDLIGSYELIDGNTIRREGPVVVAMRRGAILLLDETDYGSERLLCLQPILEGKPFFDKKTGEQIYPKPGFNVIATANTKGKGSEDGRFIGANVLNEAFLERFAITVEQEYPDAKIEKKILVRNFDVLNIKDLKFADKLVSWAETVRKSYLDGACDEIISTRRLVHICKAYAIFKDRKKSVELCLNRFDTDTKKAFFDLYNKIDDDVVVVVESEETVNIPDEANIDDLLVQVKQPNPTSIGAPNPVSSNVNHTASSSFSPQKKFTQNFQLPTADPDASLKAAKVSWVTDKILMDVSLKYSEPVVVLDDPVKNVYVIKSHGQRTEARYDRVVAFAGDVLDMLVDINEKKKKGLTVNNPFG